MKKIFSALLIGATLAMPINMTVCNANGKGNWSQPKRVGGGAHQRNLDLNQLIQEHWPQPKRLGFQRRNLDSNQAIQENWPQPKRGVLASKAKREKIAKIKKYLKTAAIVGLGALCVYEIKENIKLKQSLKDLNTEKNDLESNKREALKTKEDMLKNNKIDMLSLTLSLDQCRTDLSASNKAKGQCRTDLSASNKAKGQCQKDLSASNKAKDKCQTDLSASNKAKDKCQTELGKAKDTIKKNSNRANAKKVRTLTSDLEQCKKGKDEYVKNSKNSFGILSSFINMCNNDLNKANNDKAQCQADLNKMSKAKDKCQAELGESDKDKNRLQKNLDRSNKLKRQCQTNLSASNKAKGKCQTELSKSNKAKGKCQIELSKSNKAKGQCQTELSASNQAKDKCRIELDELNQPKVQYKEESTNCEKSLKLEQQNIVNLTSQASKALWTYDTYLKQCAITVSKEDKLKEKQQENSQSTEETNGDIVLFQSAEKVA